MTVYHILCLVPWTSWMQSVALYQPAHCCSIHLFKLHLTSNSDTKPVKGAVSLWCPSTCESTRRAAQHLEEFTNSGRACGVWYHSTKTFVSCWLWEKVPSTYVTGQVAMAAGLRRMPSWSSGPRYVKDWCQITRPTSKRLENPWGRVDDTLTWVQEDGGRGGRGGVPHLLPTIIM